MDPGLELLTQDQDRPRTRTRPRPRTRSDPGPGPGPTQDQAERSKISSRVLQSSLSWSLTRLFLSECSFDDLLL